MEIDAINAMLGIVSMIMLSTALGFFMGWRIRDLESPPEESVYED